MSPAAHEFVEWMRRLGWSQSETARQLLVTPSHINQIVRGKAEPSAAMLQLLRLTAARQGVEGSVEAVAAAPPEDELERFWRELRRQRLDGMPPAEQRAFVKAWAVVLGLAWPPGRK
ncbi:MAG: helix-turn-helix transcriptional regulator [Verrucomicrobiae bacterium]|nr:helix-turn-helix transcriptional regulator [Verrucomicrobiae bacterium]